MISDRLSRLRQEMSDLNINALIVPSNDPHQSEYPPKYWEIRAWISGFTGSAGLVVVSTDKAGLWTDSRYFIQAEKQLNGSGIDLHKVIDRSSPGYIEWICDNLKQGDTVGLIGELVSLDQYNSMQKKLSAYGINVKLIEDPFRHIWSDRPPLPDDSIFEHGIAFAGKARQDKLKEIREIMNEKDCQYHLVTSLDDIAWICNLRSTDVECNPVFVAYLLITPTQAIIFTRKSKISDELNAQLNNYGFAVKPYESIFDHLAGIDPAMQVMLDTRLANMSVIDALKHVQTQNVICPAIMMKAQKTDHEIAQFRNAMIKDGVALCKAYHWLEKTLKERKVSEYEFAMKIKACRTEQEHYYGESFHAIVGYRSNGAIIHYRPVEGDCFDIENSGMLLVDCGAQYMDGTTDITRTITLDEPSEEQKTNYTLVLKGNIALAAAKFPKGTTGTQLDILARQFLWNKSKNYAHGTGHGVGFFNSVHENPQGIDPSSKGRGRIEQLPGMISSNEPGYYIEGEYGIRIETLILCTESAEPGFLEFETITLYPMDGKLIQTGLLSQDERKWLNEYHQTVYDKLSPHLDDELKDWLKDKCLQI